MTDTTLQFPPTEPNGPPSRRRRVVLAIVATVSALVLVVTGIAYALTRGDSGTDTAIPATAPPSPTVTVPSTAPTGSTGTGPSTAAPTTESPASSTTPPGSPTVPVFGYEPLWPFASVRDAMAWQRQDGGEHQPWRLDPEFTALVFTGDYLGFDELDAVTSMRVVGDEAWIGVGPTLSEGPGPTAAVLHLARIGAGKYRPWEVVGTRDTTLSLTSPAYGAEIVSPITVGGRITGVDESLTVRIRALDRPVLGSATGIPAGGRNAPWSATLTYQPSTARVATIVVSTGGHVRAVERFAITGVHLVQR